MFDLDETIRQRRSVRGFLPRPVPRELLLEALELAQHAPSNCNVQPWRVYLASGEVAQGLREKLVEAAKAGLPQQADPPIDVFFAGYRDRQIACAKELYGQMGVARDDRPARFAAELRNFEFFDAPHVAYVCMDERFGLGVALDVGMYVQTLMLALWARGVASCPQAALRSYPGIAREQLGIAAEERILCGLSIGYEDAEFPANRTRQPRDPVEMNVRLLG
jgi:nitroreductase